MPEIARRALRKPKAFARHWFDKAATPLRAELHQLIARVTRQLHALEGEQRVTRLGLQEEVARLRQTACDMQAQIAQLRDAATGVRAEMAAMHQTLSATQADHARQLSVRTTNDWIEHLPVASEPLVSVIMPTRDRAAVLGRAIDSVVKQSYANWELLIVDDGSVDATEEVLGTLSDPRIHSIRFSGQGCCAARNVALRQARGSIVTYLDDDNVMHPNWLKAVVWGFEQRPASDVLYGAFVVDDTGRILPSGVPGELPRLYWHPYDHHQVVQGNVADIGAIAHRAGLPEAYFDETLVEMGDWDLLLRLTREAPPFVLPAVACFYTTDAPHRLSGGPTFDADIALVRKKNRRSA